MKIFKITNFVGYNSMNYYSEALYLYWVLKYEN